MIRKLTFGAFVLLVLAFCIGPDAAWAKDTSSRLYDLESRIESLENQSPTPSTGVHWIGPLDFEHLWREMVFMRGQYVGIWNNWWAWPTEILAPIRIPFDCTITEIQFRAKDLVKPEPYEEDGLIEFRIYDGVYNPVSDTYDPIYTFDTSAWAPSGNYVLTSSGPISLPYSIGPRPWWVGVTFYTPVEYQRINWVRLYYTIP